MRPFRWEPFRLRPFLVGLVLNALSAGLLLAVSSRFPQHREYFHATFAALFALACAWAIVDDRKPERRG